MDDWEKTLTKMRIAVRRGALALATRSAHETISPSAIEDFKNEFIELADYIKWVNNISNVNRHLKPQRANTNIISLGRDCIGRTLPVKFGMMETRNEGRKRLPFDLATHPVASVLQLLKTKFEAYRDASAYSFNNHGLPQISGLNIVFNHEDNDKIHEEGFGYLVNKNSHRVVNFYEYCCQSDLIFVLHARKSEVLAVAALERYLKQAYPRSRILLIAEHTDEFIELSARSNGFMILTAPTYDQTYKWHLPGVFCTKRGQSIEMEIHQALHEMMDSRNWENTSE